MSNYLVIGGAGFIGSNLVERLLEEGHNVYIIDNYSTGHPNNIPQKAVFLERSIERFCSEYDDPQLDGVFHLGQPSSSPMYRTNRSLVGRTIAEFTNLLKYCRDHKVKVVYASTSSVYNRNKPPYDESMSIFPTDFYTETRYLMERLAMVYYEMDQVKSVGLRLFSVYGPHEEYKKNYANIITQLVWAKKNNQTFDIYGDGEQRRDATYVSDVVEGFMLAMQTDIACDIFNIGSGVSHSFNEIIKIIGTKVNYVPMPLKNYVDVTLANTVKAQEILGFKAKVALADGLEKLKIYSSSH